MARDKRWRRQDRARGRYAPRLWPVWLVAPIWVAVAIALAVVIYLLLHAVDVPRPGPNGGPASRDPLDVIKTTITVAGFVGAVLVGVYGYRKQRLVEGDARRADAEQLAQRYTTAASQLGHEKAAVRLAGVYAMARLADDWDEQRQVCIDVLCAYLRMPYTPPDEQPPAEDAPAEAHTRYETRRQEQQVRLTAQHILSRNLRIVHQGHRRWWHRTPPPAAPTWSGIRLNLTGALLLEFPLAGCQLNYADLTGAQFTGVADFQGAQFTGEAYFRGAQFTGGALFVGAQFTGGALFVGAQFTGGALFVGAQFTGGAYFEGAQFTGGAYFVDAHFIGVADFEGARVASAAESGSVWPLGWTTRPAQLDNGEDPAFQYLTKVEDGNPPDT